MRHYGKCWRCGCDYWSVRPECVACGAPAERPLRLPRHVAVLAAAALALSLLALALWLCAWLL